MPADSDGRACNPGRQERHPVRLFILSYSTVVALMPSCARRRSHWLGR
jgi:hypothetical protein